MAHVKDILSDFVIGSSTTYQNLSMFPLSGGATPGVSHLSVDEAIAQRLLEITEVSDSGEVPNLKVTNRGERPILILAGEELVGAKQNRLINVTFLLAGLTSVIMPVSCVEQGRWRSKGKEFHSEQRMSSPQLRTRVERDVQSSIRAGRGFKADQAGVWEEISTKMANMNVASPTMAMNAMYNSYDDQLRQYTDSFKPEAGQQGMLMAINGQVAGLELFDSPASLSKYFEKLVTSYALDAIDLQDEAPSTNDLESRARAWTAALLEVPVHSRPSLGLGYDLRLEGERTTGSALIYEDSILYLSAFALPETERDRKTSTLARAGQRRLY